MKRVRGLTAVSILSVALVAGVVGAQLAGTPAPTSVTISPASTDAEPPATEVPEPAVVPVVAPQRAEPAVVPAEPETDSVTTPQNTRPTSGDIELRSTRRPKPSPKPAPVVAEPVVRATSAPEPTGRPVEPVEAPKPKPECQDGMTSVGRERGEQVSRACVGGKWVVTERKTIDDPAAGSDQRGPTAEPEPVG